MTDLLDRLETEVTALAERDGLTPDDVCLLLTHIDSAIKRAREAKEQLEDFLVRWLPANGGELRIGDVRYWIGENKTEKCLNVNKCVGALYEAVQGDFDAFCDCLSSNGIKPGAARKVLGDKYSQHFVTKVTAKLESDGKPKKSLQNINTAFVR